MNYEFHWVHKGNSRFYRIYVYKDLLGALTLTSVWGGISSRLGNYKHTIFDNLESAFEFIEDMKKRRTSRGYDLINTSYAS